MRAASRGWPLPSRAPRRTGITAHTLRDCRRGVHGRAAHFGGARSAVHLAQTFPLAARALPRNKTRSFLTTLGVNIGVASVISRERAHQVVR
jgi:hypothetical protein